MGRDRQRIMEGSYQPMLATALEYARGDRASRIASWRQIVDILAQGGDRIDGAARRDAFAALDGVGLDVPVAQRRLASASLAGRVTDTALVTLFAHDVPAVAAPILAQLVLHDTRWSALLPTLPAASRNILRNRRDLPDVARSALARFAAADLALPAAPSAVQVAPAPRVSAPDMAPGSTPIIDLVERIAQYRQRTATDTAPAAASAGEHVGSVFDFETDVDGIVTWAEGVPRLPVIGLSIAQAAESGAAGVDAAAASAWRRRAPLGPNRLLIAGSGGVAGDWTIEAAALFDPHSGRFVGYRGEARRPRAGERAVTRLPDTAAAVDSIRQLVHELRTPLNAIGGFAAMIEGQFLGPAASSHRDQANAIVGEVARLVTLIDDLDLAARLDAGQGFPAAAPAALSTAVARAVDDQRAVLAERGVMLRLDLPAADIECDVGDGGYAIVTRLIAGVVAAASMGEAIAIAVRPTAVGGLVRIGLPVALQGVETARLLAADAEGDPPAASPLGLGFTLRLCTRLASEAGGRFAVASDAFELALPGVRADESHIAR